MVMSQDSNTASVTFSEKVMAIANRIPGTSHNHVIDLENMVKNFSETIKGVEFTDDALVNDLLDLAGGIVSRDYGWAKIETAALFNKVSGIILRYRK